jgi:transposase-like protein
VRISIDKRDTVFSKIVRLRARWNCDRCGRFFNLGHGLQCSHFYGRRHRATRWAFDNAAAHCFACHNFLGENPIEFAAWVRKFLGDVRYEELTQKHRQVVKRTKADLEALYQHLKEQLRLLEANADYAVVDYD